MLERLIKNLTVRRTCLIVSGYILANIPAAIYTYTRPAHEVRATLDEQLKSEMDAQRDISGGFVYTNFRLLGTIMGYNARKIVKNDQNPKPLTNSIIL